MPFNPFSALTSKIFGALAVFFLAFALIQTVRIEGFLFIHGYKQDLAKRDDLIAGFKMASENAQRQVVAQQAQIGELQKELTHETNAVADAVAVAGRNAFDRYAARNRVRPECVGGLSPAAPADVSGDTPQPPREAYTTEYVAVSRPDYDHATAAALQAAIDWEYFQALIRSGAAIPEPEIGK